MTAFAYSLIAVAVCLMIAALIVVIRSEFVAQRNHVRPASASSAELWPKRWDSQRFSALNLGAIALGLAYGVIFRLFAGGKWSGGPGNVTLTLSFLLLGPLAIGFLSVYPVAKQTRLSTVRLLLQPCIPVLLTCASTLLLAIEGSICIVMALPIALVMSLIGGFLGATLAHFVRVRPATMLCVAALPFLLVFIETHLHRPTSIRKVENTVVIHASPAIVWQNIQSVPPIATTELHPTWTHAMGFPRPIAAELSHPGVGGVRTATFERGLTFFETVTDWQPEHELAFTIKADTAHIPPTTLDEHVTIGGPYFDVLDGAYRIQSVSNDTVLLHLTSHQRLTTDVNNYASLWTDAIMSDLQASILQVIQHRCEQNTTTSNALNQ